VTRRSSLVEFRDRLRDRGIDRSYSIAFTPRSGSTLLCRVLGHLSCGRPDEYFQYPYQSNRLSAHNCLSSAEDVLGFVESNAANRIFASKLSNDQRAHLDERLEALFEGYRRLDDLLPGHRWIVLARRDLVGQAISLYVARKSSRWHLQRGDRWDADPDVGYDYFGIYADLLYLASSAVGLDAYFQSIGVTPFRLCYEDFLERPGPSLNGLFDYLELKAPAPDPSIVHDGDLVQISRRAAALYADLRSRFLEDFLSMGRTDRHRRLGSELANWDRFFTEEQWARPCPQT